MNRVYQLVWNGALRVVQVASELSSSNQGLASGGESTVPRPRLLWGAMLATGLLAVGSPALSQVCQPTDTRACSAQGGAPTSDGRGGAGGAGNGQGGSAVNISGFAQIPGALSSIGNGGAGATGLDGTIGGAGGGGGLLGTNAAGIWAGGRGVDGADASRAPGSGGGGGAGVWTATTSLNFVAGNVATGGDGGNGGGPGAGSAAGGGGGGGGGTGVTDTVDDAQVTVASGASIVGGAGGAGGFQTVGLTFGGGGGGGGDGMLLFGANANVINAGTIRGGAGGAGGVGSGGGFTGNSGAAGAAINALNTGLVVSNGSGGIIEGGASVGNGAAGLGIITQGGASLTNAGTIAGGLVAGGGGARASAVLFNGAGNQLHLQTGSIIEGALEVADGGAAEVISAASNSIDAVKLDGNTVGAQVTFETDVSSPGALEVKSITGTGDVRSQGNNAPFTFDHIDIDGSVILNHVGVTGLDGSIISTGSQAFVARLTLLGDSSLQSQSTIGVSSTIDGAHSLVVSTPAALTLNGNIGSLARLTNLTSNSATLAIKGARAGAIDLTTTGGAITQGGVFDITGTSAFDAGTHDVLLSNANSFGGNVTATGNNIAIHAASDLSIGGITHGAAGNVSLTSDGILILPTSLATTGSISLASNGGVLAPTAQLQGGWITLTGSAGVTLLNSIITPGALTLDAGTNGNVFQVGSGVSAGELVANTSGTLDLASASNAIQTLGDISANTFVFTNAIASTVTGGVSAQSIQFNAPQGLTVTGSVDGGTGAGTLLGLSTSLTVGNGGTTGTLSGNVTDNGVLAFDRSDTVSFADTLAGSGQLLQKGSGTLLFDGNGSTFAGSTLVQAGTLIVGSAAGSTAELAGNVDVAAGAALGGHGSIDGNVSMASGSVLSPGHSVGTLSVNGDLSMAQGSSMDVELGTAGVGDLVAVNGNLALNGVTLNVSNAGGMGPGVYTIFSYTGALTETNGGLAFGATPAGHTLQLLTLLGSKQINILDASNTTLNFWNANGLASGAQMGGGDGTWSTTSPHWTDAVGSITGAMSPQPGFAVFGGAAGTVTVDDTSGAVSANGVQFMSDAYHLTGDALTLTGVSGAAPVLRVSGGATAIVDNVINSVNGIDKTDAGTLVLTGQNIYQGNTVLSGGELSVSSDGNLGVTANALDFEGGMLQVTGTSYRATNRNIFWGSGGGFDIADAGNTFTVSQNLVGSGSLYKTGAGMLVLSGTNSYTGGTVIGQGTLQGDAASLGGNIVNNATLVFDQSTDGTFNGAISGTGQLIKNGAGRLVLSGASTYTGGTLVNAGNLQGNTAGLQGAIVDNATVTFAQDTDATFNGNLSGSGQLVKAGAGTLTLAAGNTYSGGTMIDGGALQGDTSSLHGAITNNAKLIFAQQTDGVFDGAISGTGQLIKNGAGTLTFNGTDAISGSTEVSAGKLVVGDDTHASASLGGTVTVDQGATLGGIGSIGGLDLSGTLTPGNSIGTLTVNGNAVFRTVSSYQLEVSPDGTSDRLAATGHVSILGGSALALASNGNWAPQTQFQVITADGGVSGTFDSVTSNLAFLTPQLIYSAQDVTLQLERNDVSFASVAQTRNQRAVAATLESLGMTNPLYHALVGLDAGTARQRFDALSGEQFASTRSALVDDSRYVRDAINRHLLGLQDEGAQATDAHGVTAWTSAWGHWGDNNSDGNAARLQANGSGLLVGADLGIDSDARLGAVVGHRQASMRVDDRGSNAHATATDAGIYGDVAFGAFALRGGLAYAWQQIDESRQASFGTFAERLDARYDANVAHGFIEGGYRFQPSAGQQLEPFLNISRVQLHTDGLHENNGVAALAVADNSDAVNFATFGLRDSWSLVAQGGLNAHIAIGWQQAWGDVLPVSRLRFAGSNSFDVAGTPIARHAGVVDAGLSFAATRNVWFDASYVGRYGDGSKDQGARLGVTVQW